MQNKEKKTDPEFMRKIGSKGGKNSTSRPFRDNPDMAKQVGAIGGKKSKRGKAKKNDS